ncbi:MAG TPA: mechanosensitive ion channel family protein [Verrucomicrobiales bacterium]|nr:mechanosensitive ion channel family protein [Verrucomicrobiales bacterium]
MIHCLSATFFTFLLLSPLSAQEPVTTNSTPIEVEKVTSDEAIQKRIRGIFDAVGGFEQIDITVKSGVITLSGEVPSAKIRKDAISLSDRTDGVVITLDRMTEPVEITSQFTPAYEKLKQMGRTIIVKLPLIGAAMLILLLARLTSRLLGKRRGWMNRFQFSSLGRDLALRISRLVIYLVALLVVLELLDATAIVGAVIGAAGLAGIALGFAFKNIVENYLAGVILSTRNPFEIGDAVEIDGKAGKVARLTSRDTVLVTLDGNHLRIPNAMVMNSVLLNYSRNPLRRFDFFVGVSTDFDLSEVRRIAVDTLRKNPAVLEDPAPMVVIDSLGDSAVLMQFFAWIDQNHHSFLKAKSESIRLIKEAFDEAGIEMPEPIYTVQLRGENILSPESDTSRKVLKPERTVSLPKDSAEEDLTVDRSIDEQIEDEEELSREENLLSSPSP